MRAANPRCTALLSIFIDLFALTQNNDLLWHDDTVGGEGAISFEANAVPNDYHLSGQDLCLCHVATVSCVLRVHLCRFRGDGTRYTGY